MMKSLAACVSDLAMAGSGLAFDKTAYDACLSAGERAKRELLTLGLTQQRVDDLHADAIRTFMENASLCESKIEQMMLGVLCQCVIGEAYPPVVHNLMSDERWPDGYMVIVPQFPLARFRLDFLIRIGTHTIAVECDGADYHNSPEARERDNRRDTYLKKLGVPTLRYSGQWIWKNRERGIADEIVAICGA